MTLNRARDLLPTVVITVLSMLQALALELYWSQFSQEDVLWGGGITALMSWLQYAVMLMGILLVWLFYVSLMLRFTWLPTMQDTITPFIIGLLEFSMVNAAGIDTLGLWFLLLGATFGVSVTASHFVMRRARQDPENAYFFSQQQPASWRDLARRLWMAPVLMLWGVALLYYPQAQWLALAGLIMAVVALTAQLAITHRFWIRPEIEA